MDTTKKTDITKEFRLHERDTGSADVQIALLTERINDFLAHFDARNVFGNEELAGLAEQARAALKGADGEALRSAPILRANVAAAFEEIKSKLNGMIGDAPVRAISLDDEA